MSSQMVQNVRTTKKGNHYIVMEVSDLSCSYCGAGIGFACMTKDGKPMSTFHKARNDFKDKILVPVKLYPQPE